MKFKKEVIRMLIAVNLLALAIVLDVLTSAIPGLNLSMPFGGKFFGLSMLPLVMVGLLVGLKYGLLTGFLYALYNFGIDYIVYLETLRITLESWTGTSWSAGMIILLILLDYVIPFTAFGLSGLFHDGFKHKLNLIKATLFVSLIRLVSSSLSGVLLWSSSIEYANEQVENGVESPDLATRIFSAVGNNVWLYSFGYNFIYIFTTTVLVLFISLLTFKRLQSLVERMEQY